MEQKTSGMKTKTKQAKPLRAMTWAMCVVLLGTAGCSDELRPDEPEGAYLLWRQALLEGDTKGVYQYLDKDTKAIFEERASQLQIMSEDIVRYLPQVDQKLARKQTGVELLKNENIIDGESLFLYLFRPKKLEVTPEIEIGTEPSDIIVDKEKGEAAIVTYAEQKYILKREDDKVWRIVSWSDQAEQSTKWVLDNRSALDQTVQDLINEEQEEIKAIITFLLKEEKRTKTKAP